jgi:hypothetical protein
MLYTGSKVGVSMEHPRRSNPYPAAFRPVDGASVFESNAFSYAITKLYPSAFHLVRQSLSLRKQCFLLCCNYTTSFGFSVL